MGRFLAIAFESLGEQSLVSYFGAMEYKKSPEMLVVVWGTKAGVNANSLEYVSSLLWS